jgi:hypothetical protein
MSDETDPVREHLDKAENWLMRAEGNRGELIDLRERLGRDHVTDEGMYLKDMMTSAADLAELHRAMAQTINDLTPQRYALEPERAVREQLKADAEAHQAQTIRPGADLEPEAEGELWTTGDGWFYYTVSAIPAEEAAGPGAGYVEKPRWLRVRHYAQVLRWTPGTTPDSQADTWSDLATYIDMLRHPTAEERKAFYGPEPEPTPEEVREAIGDIDGPPPATLGEAFRTPYSVKAKPPAPVAWFPEDDVTMKAWLRGLDPAQLNRLVAAASNERTERLYAE